MYVRIAIMTSVNIMKPDNSAVPFFLDSHNLNKPSTSNQATSGKKKNNLIGEISEITHSPGNNDCENSSIIPKNINIKLAKSTQHNTERIVATILFLQIKNDIIT